MPYRRVKMGSVMRSAAIKSESTYNRKSPVFKNVLKYRTYYDSNTFGLVVCFRVYDTEFGFTLCIDVSSQPTTSVGREFNQTEV